MEETLLLNGSENGTPRDGEPYSPVHDEEADASLLNYQDAQIAVARLKATEPYSLWIVDQAIQIRGTD